MQTIAELGTHTFQAVLSNSIKRFGDRPALSFVTGAPVSYQEAGEKITALQGLLYRLGVNPGDKVALYSHSMPHWGIAYFAIVTMGAVAVPLLPDFTDKEVRACLEHAGAAFAVVSDKLMPKIPESLSVLIDIHDFSVKKGVEIRTDNALEHTCREDDTASVIYTSGTTGRSKGVELSHKNLVWNAVAGQSCQRINEYDRALSILPLSHVYEFTIGFLMFFLNGACVYYLEGIPSPRILLPAMQKIRPTMMLSVPIIMEKIYRNKILPALTATPLRAKLYRTKLGRKILDRLAGKQLKKTFGGSLKIFGARRLKNRYGNRTIYEKCTVPLCDRVWTDGDESACRRFDRSANGAGVDWLYRSRCGSENRSSRSADRCRRTAGERPECDERLL